MAKRARVSNGSEWQTELLRWLAPFLAALPRSTQRRWAPVYVEGLLGPSPRKSVEPMAATVAVGDYDQLHHFLSTTAWDAAPVLRMLAATAQRMVGGPGAVLIVDDTTLLKKGTHSVGVGQQYSGQAGKLANCQTLVSLTLARDEVPVPIALRLFLPKAWAGDATRCRQAGVPPEARVHRQKWQLALEALDRVREAGVTFGLVLADAAYGSCAEFRQGLTARGLTWAVGVRTNQFVYPRSVRLTWHYQHGGHRRRRKHPLPATAPESVVEVAARRLKWRRVTWRHGTKGRLTAEFAALRVRTATEVALISGWKVPGAEAWLERFPSGNAAPTGGSSSI